MQLRNALKQKQKELRKSSIREELKTFKMVYSFPATVAARGYHISKSTTWDQAKVKEKVLAEIGSKKKNKNKKNQKKLICITVILEHQSIKTVVHITGEMSQHVHFFLRDGHGYIDETVKSVG